MRKINTRDFHVATRTTSREVNRRIALNLIREHEPLSRADLARRMNVARPVVTMLVNDLISEDLVYEGATGASLRGRKPTLLHVRTEGRFVVAADVRFSRTYLMLSDFGGAQHALESFDTIFEPKALIDELARRVKKMLKTHKAALACEGLGLVVPGAVDAPTGRVVNSPQLGWRDVDVRRPLAAKTGLPVSIENAAMACALAQVWTGGGEETNNFAYVTVSDGVGVGVVIDGALVRGAANTAGEFGHNPLSFDGPRCLCGRIGCWEAYTSNLATIARYTGEDLTRVDLRKLRDAERGGAELPLMTEIVERACAGEERARAALDESARFLGLGLGAVVNALNPARVFIGGEITGAWELIEATVRARVAERALTETAAATPLIAEPVGARPRLRGATALVAAPMFAAPRVA